MLPIPPQYALIAKMAAVGALLLGTSWLVADYKDRGHRAEIAEMQAEAERTLTAVTEANRLKEKADADKAREIDAMYQGMVNDAYAGRDAFAERLRIARRGASNCSATAREAADTGVREEPAGSGDDGSGSADPAHDLRDAALELQRYAVACHSWTVSVGR